MSTKRSTEMTHTIDISDRWSAIEASYGGYVVSLVAAAIERLPTAFLPLSLTVEFLGSVRTGPLEVRSGFVHAGAQSATACVDLIQGHPKAVAVAKLLEAGAEPIWNDALDLSGVTQPGDLGHQVLPYGRLPWEDQVELRLLDEPRHPLKPVRGWVRLVSDARADVWPAAGRNVERGTRDLNAFHSSSLLLDVMPSGLYGQETPPANVPTVEFTLHAAPGRIRFAEWYFVTQRLLWSGVDSSLEESTLHDREGAFVAVARQTRRVIPA